MFLSERREFPSSAPCLAGGKKLVDSSRLDVVKIARVPDMLPSMSGTRAILTIDVWLTVHRNSVWIRKTN